jgi:hypothetical protein
VVNATCSIGECEQPPIARGWCSKHYGRWRNNGDPLALRPPHQRPKVSLVRDGQGRKRCTLCREWKPESQYHRGKSLDGLAARCRECSRIDRQARAEAHRDAKRQKKFGMTRAAFDELLRSQGGRCVICLTDEPGGGRHWCVDHDHRCCTGPTSCGMCVRGLLCNRCNRLLGFADDDPALLANAITYLKRWERGVDYQ